MGKRRLLLVVMLVGLIGLVRWGMPQNFGFSMMRVNRVVHQLETRLPDGQDQAGTPVEKIAAEHPLHRTYYYHFAGSVPVNVRPIFEEAVAVYNKTGLVKLVAGKPQQKQNGITFFTYHKETSTAPNFLELGEGGPEIRRYVGLGSYTINRARAGLNLAHPEAGIRASVAIHELGHAIGLEHSKSRRSIMYPLDQDHERLSAADQKTLRVLYAQNG
ncbi:matrixin family metalloprotease [Levilactobacillus fuyuanensis]|uniref:Matrixin family metalloprotease n=1 Tax=Levilactobacillus fuyuanensis TaxID=2486022 RepID=A0ABW4H5C9_9LACO|nr:matrixin family metalloprotease [Levilactobacillus fuyuanensis]